MASTALKVRVGIFVIVGISLAVGTVIGLFAWYSTQDTRYYVTYFDESTSGLDIDAAVKYRGVSIGRVADILIAPDEQHVEVIMEIKSSFLMKPEFVARVKYAGITGLRYVELEPFQEGMKRESMDFTFKPDHDYMVVPSAPGDLEQLGITIRKTFKNINQLDIKEISDKVTSVLDNLDILVAQLKDADTVNNLNSAIAQLNSPKIAKTIKYLESATQKLNKLMLELDAESLPNKVNAFLEEGTLLSRNLNAMSLELQGMAQIDDVMRATADTVKNLNQTLKQGASTIIFAEPPKPRATYGN
jgi:ABC-type transporter Mla subunit MlaD